MINLGMMGCSDVNSRYCPCLLADTNHCIVCSHLHDKELCDCKWGGMCILYEKHWNPKTAHTMDTDYTLRNEIETKFTILSELNSSTYVLEIAVDKEMADSLDRTGSFVFIKYAFDKECCYFPVGIMKVDGINLQVVIEKVGPKSSRMFLDNNQKITVRGPYYNGVLGQPWIDNLTCGKIILVAGGIGQAPALPLSYKLIRNKNSIQALIAPGKVGKLFISDELQAQGVAIHPVSSLRREGTQVFSEWIKANPDLVVSAGPDQQHYYLINLMKEAGLDIPMAVTNNSVMCCGEGICGSCLRETKDHKKVRICKTQVAFSQLI